MNTTKPTYFNLLHPTIAVMAILLLGCNNPDRSKDLRKMKTYNHKGDLLREYWINGDSLIEGRCIDYYEDGKIKSISFYKDGKKDSIQKLFYPDGKSIMQVFYNKNDTVGGEVQNFYISGKLQSQYWYVKGKAFGSAYWFYESGALKMYLFYDWRGRPVYRKDYDENGILTAEKGHGFADSRQNKSPHAMHIGEEYKESFLLIAPPKQKRNLLIRASINNNEKLIESVPLNNDLVYNFSYKCERKGQIRFRFGLFLEDSLTHEIDTTYAIQFDMHIGARQ